MDGIKFLDYLFHGKELRYIDSYFKMLNGYSPTFTSYSGGVYEMDLTRTAVNSFASQPVVTVDGEGAVGLELEEVFCDATDIARKYQSGETEVTIPLNTYLAMLKTRGGAELESYGKTINFVSTINTNSNLKFKSDFDLGDRITCKEEKWGIQIDARITEVTETYQKGEETIEATFGDSLPTLVDQIRKVR